MNARSLLAALALTSAALAAQAEIKILRASSEFNPDEVNLEELRAFAESGGYVVCTDALYGRIWKFLALVGEGFGDVKWKTCDSWKADGDSRTAPVGKEPHPLVNFPNVIDDADYWGHFRKETCTGWTVLEACGDGEPMMLYRPLGKGGILVCANLWWFGEVPKLLIENINAWGALNAAGVPAKTADITPFRNGKGCVRIGLEKPLANKAKLELTVQPAGEGQKPAVFSKKFAKDGVTLDYELDFVGKVEFELAVVAGATRTTLFTKTVDFASPLTLAPADRRGRLSTARRTDGVWLKAGINPAKGKLENALIRVAVTSVASGKAISKDEVKLPAKDVPSEYFFRVGFPKDAPAGKYKVAAELKPASGLPLGKAEAELEVVGPEEGQFMVDADGMVLKNGQPFFPLGIYHAEPDDYEEVKELGFNFVQSFKYLMCLRDGIAKAEKAGLPVLLESDYKDIPLHALDAWLKSPSTAMWYVADEPKENWEQRLHDAYDGYRNYDKSGLTFITSNRPDLFNWLSGFADVFSCDCYGDMGKCVRWLRRANRQIRPGQAFVFVPPAIPKKAEWLRAQAFLGIAHGAHGLIWYTWRDKAHPNETLFDRDEHKTLFRSLLSELGSNAEWLTSTQRVRFESGSVHGIVLGDPAKTRRAFVVNVLEDPAKDSVTLEDGTVVNCELGSLEAKIVEVEPVTKKQKPRRKKAK